MPEREHECLCGTCPPCRRAHRALLAEYTPRPTPPTQLSPLAQAVLDDDQHTIDTRLPVRNTRPVLAHQRDGRSTARRRTVAQGRAPRRLPPPQEFPCPTCGETVGLKASGKGGLTVTSAAVDGQCEACGMREGYLATVAEVNAIKERDGKLTLALRSRRRKARLHAQRITRDGRAYHPDAHHGTNHAYLHFGCRCAQCRAWKTADNATRRTRQIGA